MTLDPAFVAIGAELTHKHQPCPFSDHADSDPSFRIHGRRWICTCGHGDVLDAIKRFYGVGYAEACRIYDGEESARHTPPKTHPKAIPDKKPTDAYALALWQAANRDDAFVAAHPYCQRKGVWHAFGAARGLASGSVIGQGADCILIPIRPNGIDEPIAVQAVSATGKKQTFGQLANAFLLLGDERDLKSAWICCEGWATAQSARQAERQSVVLISFGKGRQRKVAELAAARYQPERIAIFAESDE